MDALPICFEAAIVCKPPPELLFIVCYLAHVFMLMPWWKRLEESLLKRRNRI